MVYNHGNLELMIRELMELNNVDCHIPEDYGSKHTLLKELMTISVPGDLSDFYYEAEKEFYLTKMDKKEIISVEDIKGKLLDNIFIHKGDITEIVADAIVNAANEKLLGCFIPGHHCIDNAIHLSAGLGLRNECNDLMLGQGHDEKVGSAKVTKGYNLPSKYVVHTVGPNLNGLDRLSMDQVVEQLRSCYLSVLRAVREYKDIRSVVFCSISTGVYGVPIDVASEVALNTINTYLMNEAHHLDKVVLDVFSKEDYNEYKKQAEKIKRSY